MSWMQTHREWGNRRTIRGIAHYMYWGGNDRGHVAACGYAPHARTQMLPAGERVPRCVRCSRKHETLARDRARKLGGAR